MPHPGKDKNHGATFDNQLIELESIDSTNNYAMGLIHEGMASDGLTVLARHQWAGKGQRGKAWLSEPGESLTMSLIIEPGKLILSQQFLFSASITLGVLDLVKDFESNNWHIKWPNDIYWNDRKAAGILVESVIQGNKWPFAIAGIGINLNQDQFSKEIPNAISLKQITRSNHDPASVARKLIPLIHHRTNQLRKEPLNILYEFNQALYRRNESIIIKKENELISVTLIGVKETGELMTDIGSFAVGEIEFKLRT